MGAEVGGGVQSEQAEEAGGVVGQGTVGPGEHRAHGAGFVFVVDGQGIPQGGLVTQVLDEFCQRHARPAGGAFGRDAQRQG